MSKKLFKRGNHKIGKDTLIFNMGPASLCPSKDRGLCQVAHKCYALRDERRYHHVVPQYRFRQARFWLENNAETIANTIKAKAGSVRSGRIKYVRINESGDFWTQECVNKLFEVANEVPELRFYTYTARRDLSFEGRPSNLVINGSGFMIDNNFEAVNEVTGPNECAGDCKTCHVCKYALNIKIEAGMH